MSKRLWVMVALFSVVVLIFVMVSCGGKTQQQVPSPAPKSEGTSATPSEKVPSEKESQATSKPETELAKTLQSEGAPAQAQSVSAGKPRIEAVDPVYDFGEKPNIEKVEHEFTIKNTGDGVLNITRVSTSCGCTVAQPEKKELQPGESTVVKATLNLAGRNGPITKTVTIFSNDPENPQLTLEFKGVAKSLIAIEPDRLVQFGEFPSDEKPEPKTVEIKSVVPELKFSITKVDMGEDNPFDYKLETVEEGKHYRITFSLAKELPVNQNIWKRVVIITDPQLEGKPEAISALKSLMITLAARALGPIEVSPNPLTITVSKDEELPQQQGEEANQKSEEKKSPPTTTVYVRVKGVKDKDFKITEVVPPVPEITVDVNERDKGDFILKLSNIPRDENLDGKKFIIKTSSPSAPEVELGIKTVRYPSRPKTAFSPSSPSNLSESLKKMVEQKKYMAPQTLNAPVPSEQLQSQLQSEPQSQHQTSNVSLPSSTAGTSK